MGTPRAGKKLPEAGRDDLLAILESRFTQNMKRHAHLDWAEVRRKLLDHPDKLWSLNEMEATGGEPDAIGRDEMTGEFVFSDCSPETPKGRTSLCYDRAGLESRKEHRPRDTAIGMAEAMGIRVLSEAQYIALQKLGEFDRKTSSWVETPAETRKLGGALYCELRYGRVFTGHNGAQSYYGSRGFRGSIAV